MIGACFRLLTRLVALYAVGGTYNVSAGAPADYIVLTSTDLVAQVQNEVPNVFSASSSTALHTHANAAILELLWRAVPPDPHAHHSEVWASATTTPVSVANVSIKTTYQNAVYGFAASMTPDQAAWVQRSSHVYAVEKDSAVRINPDHASLRKPAGGGDTALGGPSSGAARVPWNLDRLDQRYLPLDGGYKNSPDSRQGQGVDVYVLDTGIRPDHPEFLGDPLVPTRVIGGVSFINDDKGWADCNGHGTHCASTAGGRTVGVAPLVSLYGVRTLGCDGSGAFSGVLAGIDWVVRNAGVRGRPSVISMSLGGGVSNAVNSAIRAAVRTHNIAVVVAAGNENSDACMYSPASSTDAITVSATTVLDRASGFGNYGSCVDIYAPGSRIKGADYRTEGYTYMSGTSMACPHVSGAAALFMQRGGARAGAAAARAALTSCATAGVITRSRVAVPQGLLYTRCLLSETPAAPTAVPTRRAPSTDACRTIDNVNCAFPFRFAGVVYRACTTAADSQQRAWCSTQTAAGDHVQGQWGYCQALLPCFLGQCPSTLLAQAANTPGEGAGNTTRSSTERRCAAQDYLYATLALLAAGGGSAAVHVCITRRRRAG